jgi:hypothetical protein
MKKYKWTLLIFSLVAAMFLIVACDFDNISNPADKLEIRVKNIARETFVSVDILDAKTGEQVNDPIIAEVSGEGSGLVINEINEPTTYFDVENGVLLFSIADGVVPTKDNPVKLNILLKSNDYLSTSQPVRVTKAGMNTFSAVMTNANSTPEGVVSNQEDGGTTDASGGMTDSTVVSSGEDEESGGEASIAIAQGTKLKDADGNVLSGNVETRVTYFNPLNEQSLSAFPGGFSVETDADGEGNFVTAGFVAIDMTVNGTEVEQFDGDVNINIKVPQGTINPNTGQPVQPGEKIPVYSYDEDAGTWQYEGEVTVPEQDALGKSNGTYSVSINKVTHLSYWNLDWFEGNSCYNYPVLKFESTSGSFDRVRAKVFKRVNGNLERVSWWNEKVIYQSDAEKTLYGFPANASDVVVKVYSVYTEEEIGSLDIANLCVNQTFTVQFTDVQLLDVVVNVQIKCEDASVTLDGIPLYARKYGSWTWNSLGTISNGQVNATFYPDSYFDFAVYFDGDWYYTKDYADDIIDHAAKNGVTLEQNSEGYLKMSANNENITVILEDIDSICDEF